MDFDQATGLLVETLTGPVSSADLLAASDYKQRHPVLRNATRGIVDLDAAELALDSKELRIVVAQLRRSACPGRWAIVARADLAYGMSRMAVALMDDVRPIAVFRTRSEASDWLSVA
jgi:hypothetical protein